MCAAARSEDIHIWLVPRFHSALHDTFNLSNNIIKCKSAESWEKEKAQWPVKHFTMFGTFILSGEIVN